MNDQRDVSGFLRNGLAPLLTEFNCGAVAIHHTNKPPSGKEKPDWSGGDFAYLGSGSAEFANWSRAVLAIRSLGSHDVFELRAGKRGGRLRWRDADGQPTYARHIAHARESGRICWREPEAFEVKKSGRPPNGVSAEDVRDLLPREGLTFGKWAEAAKEEFGLAQGTLRHRRDELVSLKRVHRSPLTGRWMKQGE